VKKRILDARIQEVLDILVEQYTEDYQTKDLARRVCLSLSRIPHLFKQQVGKLLQYTFCPITKMRWMWVVNPLIISQNSLHLFMVYPFKLPQIASG
jgi:AraC-like DNA-binding protein